MADRIPQYSLFPQNLAPNLHNQQQLPQQSQQQPQAESQLVPGLTNPDHGRMWQQMQNQYRSQTGNDINTSQINQQVVDFMRSQNLARSQGQQPMVQQSQQQFGLGPQRMNAPPTFHELQNNQAPQSLMQPNFGMMPNTAPMQQSMNSRSAMLQALQANPGNMSRQLQLLNLAQNQQKQQSPNAPMDFTARLAQQQQHNQSNANGSVGPSQSNQPDMFSSPVMQPSSDGVHSSPHPSSQPLIPQGNLSNPIQLSQQSTQNGQRITPNDLQERKLYLQNQISQGEASLQRLAATRPATQDPNWMQRMQQLYHDVRNKKELLGRVNSAIQLTAQAMPNTSVNAVPGGNSGNMNPMTSPSLQPPQSGAMANGHVQPNWMNQANQVQNFNMGSNSGPSPPSHASQPLITNSNAQMSTQPAPMQNVPPPRSGHTPHQLLGNQQVNTTSPRINNQFPFQGPGGQPQPGQHRLDGGSSSITIPPMEKTRFENAYTSFCRNRGIEPNLRVVLSDSRSFELHQLHVQVMREGGSSKVSQRELWPVIGGRLGFVQFPARENEPDKAGPAFAVHLSHAYTEYLQQFDLAYISTILNRLDPSKKIPQNGFPGTQGNAMQSNGSNPPDAQPNVSRSAVNNPQFLNMAMRFVNVSAADMRRQRCPEQFIQLVENMRPQLIRYQQQTSLRNVINKGVAQQPAPPELNGMPGGLPGRFSEQQESHLSVPLPPVVGRSHMSQSGPPHPGSNEGASSSKQVVRPQLPGNNVLQRPNQAQLQQAMQFVSNVKQKYATRNYQNMVQQNVPDDQRMEFNHLLEQVHKATTDFDNKIPMYFVLLNQEGYVRQLIAMVIMVAQQRILLGMNPPRYIMDLNQLRRMHMQMQTASETFEKACRAIQAGHANPPHPLASGPFQPPPHVSPVTTPAVQQLPQQPAPPSHPSTSLMGIRSASVNPPAPVKRNVATVPASPSMLGVTVSTPTSPPAPSVSTPAASVATPQPATSPQTPKSPKIKPAQKTKRKVSKANQEPVPSPVNALKRPRDEEISVSGETVASSSAGISAPSPKKVKTEWEGPTSEALLKKQQDIDSIKSNEDACNFLEQLIKMTASNDSEGSISDIAETLEMILKGVGQDPMSEGTGSSSLVSLSGGDAGDSKESLPSPQQPPADEYFEFIDFSFSGTTEEEDDGSKAPTPDLVSSSSTNPSPESGDGDPSTHSMAPDKVKIEDSGETSDPLRLGPLKEIDGGESAYYQAVNWKWESPMPTLEQPWAIFPS